VVVAGTTFKYGPNGAEGLCGGKRVIVTIARGGMYGAASPFAAAEHVESYLRAIFGFIGVTDLEIIVAEGLQMGPEIRANATTQALQAATQLRAA
jgi:FMN-dependent NADH-azoreductase